MALDRWLALLICVLCCIYGYVAWFTMDENLPRILLRNPVWPSTFPKVLSIAAALTALWIVVMQKPMPTPKEDDIDYRKFFSYRLGQAGLFIALMLSYALLLRPAGFLLSTIVFLMIGGYVLGERRWLLSLIVSSTATLSIWYLVSEVLSIYMRPLPGLFT